MVSEDKISHHLLSQTPLPQAPAEIVNDTWFIGGDGGCGVDILGITDS